MNSSRSKKNTYSEETQELFKKDLQLQEAIHGALRRSEQFRQHLNSSLSTTKYSEETLEVFKKELQFQERKQDGLRSSEQVRQTCKLLISTASDEETLEQYLKLFKNELKLQEARLDALLKSEKIGQQMFDVLLQLEYKSQGYTVVTEEDKNKTSKPSSELFLQVEKLDGPLNAVINTTDIASLANIPKETVKKVSSPRGTLFYRPAAGENKPLRAVTEISYPNDVFTL